MEEFTCETCCLTHNNSEIICHEYWSYDEVTGTFPKTSMIICKNCKCKMDNEQAMLNKTLRVTVTVPYYK